MTTGMALGANGAVVATGITAAVGLTAYLAHRVLSRGPSRLAGARARELAEKWKIGSDTAALPDEALFTHPIARKPSLNDRIAAYSRMISLIAGKSSPRMIVVAFLLGVVAGSAGCLLAHLPGWSILVVAPAAGAVFAFTLFGILREYCRRKFLGKFPEAIEVIVRGVRAGIPVAQAIEHASSLPGPTGQQFRWICDALRIGLDQTEVINTTAHRLSIPEFQFFAVCLELQREAGGPLAETLENLSAIIRARANIRSKAKVMTAETRSASVIIACVPALTFALLYCFNAEYLSVLFDTPTGNKLLASACGMLLVGLFIIFKMSSLKVR